MDVKEEERSLSPPLFDLPSLRREHGPTRQESYMTYASLPPSPLLPSPLPSPPLNSPHPASEHVTYHPPFSLWEYLREELIATDFDSHQELKWERVSNFLSVPFAVEKVSLPVKKTLLRAQ